LLHRGREQLVRQRTMLVNALRAHLAEFGLVTAQGLRNVGELIAVVPRRKNLVAPISELQIFWTPARRIGIDKNAINTGA